MRRVVAAVTALVLLPWTPTANAAPVKERLAVGEVVDIAPGVRDGDQRLARNAVRDDLAGERFYFVMPDRFANGDPRNDRGGSQDTDRLKHGFDPADKGFYHGGDLKGLHGKLDYLQGMGTTAIWMTPMFANQWVQGDSAAYHGYWTTDFTRLDPHFGTTQEMRDLIRDAHRRGMKVFFDIVANHTADVIDYAEGRHGYVSTGAQPYLDASGKPFDIAEYAGRKDFPKLDATKSFPYTPVTQGPLKKPLWLNDPTLYHNRGDSTFSGESSGQGDFNGLDDLMTEHPKVVNGMKEIFTSWIDTLGIDGYRVDTVKHVNMEFWQALAPHVKEYARKKGKPDFFVFGEVFSSDVAETSSYTTTGRMQATLDFPFQSGAVGFVAGKGATRLGEVLLDDDRYTDADSNASSLPTFLGNHDMGRVAWMIRQDRPGIADAELLSRLKLANELMYLWRGNPVVYYGDEQGFAGGGGDKLARQDMFASRTPEYAAEKLVGSDRTGAQDNFRTDTPLYQQLKSLAAFVDRDPVWRKGNQVLRYAQGDVFAFSRISEREHLVVANSGTTAATVDVPVGSTSFETGPVPVAGKVTVTVPPLSTVVLKGTSAVAAPKPTPTLVAPAAGTVLDKRVELRADGISAPNAQASFAARVEGRSDWTFLGTDDAAPYRVFADLAALPGAAAGKRVELRVVAKAGELGADGAFLTLVPAPPVQPPGTQSPDWLVVHYQRDDYTGWGLHVWGDVVEQPDWANPLPFAGETPYGRFAWVRLKPGAKQVGIIAHKGDEKDGSIDRFVDPSVTPQVWLRQGQVPVHPSEQAASGRATVHYPGDATGAVVRVAGREDVPFTNGIAELPPTTDFSVVRGTTVEASGKFASAHAWVANGRVHASRAAAENRAVVHYFRPDGDYTDWTMYHWTGSLEPSPGWNQSRVPDGRDNFGVYWSVPLAPGAPGLSYIVHKGDTKDPGPDQFLNLAEKGNEVWFLSGRDTYLLPPSAAPAADDDLTKSKAQWVSKDLVVWDVPVIASDGYRLHYGDRVLRLAPDTAEVPAKFPHLKGKPVFRVRGFTDDALRDKLSAVHTDSGGAIRHRTGVQIAGVLDDRFAPAAAKLTYGPAFDRGRASVRLWAPTAKSVKLRLFDQPSGEPRVVALKRDDASGSWSGSGNWKDKYYQFEVTDWQRTVVVTDPYSVALSVNSTHSQFADLGETRTMPRDWRADVPKGIGEAITELHVRDFSIGDQSVPAADRGTYKAFTHRDSVGMKHLAELAEAGMDTVHFQPTFDIATIPERRADQATAACDLASLPPDSPAQQECVGAVAAKDGFNWGYDPYHYDVPEGSYATDGAQSGWARSKQYREMVKSLHDNGNRVVVDVVYNHTAAAGDAPTSVLDKVVPGYYQRLNLDGSIANSTCCANTAPENAMMGKLVVDSVVRWARTYKVDGFRFDLMGHHPKANMLAIRAALDALTVARDGVDGRKIGIYGEGWDFGEVAGNARFEQATQKNMAGTGIGTFTDRLRDAVRGGGPFDDDPRVQGIGSGLAGDVNDSPANGDVAARLVNYSDLVKLGMAGNMADFRFRSTAGPVVTGRDVNYNGSPAGYTAAPGEAITYADAHDNEALYDALAFKLKPGTSMADRVRMQKIAQATVLLGQGKPFMLAGSEFLRSKSLDRNSFDSGDWFNSYDPSLRDNGFGRGLPPAADNQSKWPYAKPLLGMSKPSSADMRRALDDTLELLRIRQSSPLLALGDAALVQQKVSFPQAEAGVIVMHLDDTVGPDVDPQRRGLLVVINPFPVDTPVDVAGWLPISSETRAGAARSVVVLQR